MQYSERSEYAQQRKIRERNTKLYRLAHGPIWICLFSAPGPLTFSLFAHGFGPWNTAWLAVVLSDRYRRGPVLATPGVEPRPTSCASDEDKPNPLYRKVCYTLRGMRAQLRAAQSSPA